MPWYLPWSESIKKRASRYLLQRYLGQFLEEKLTLDQLTVDLYNGTGAVSDVRLDVQALNELGEQQNLPIEFVDGYISGMSVSIPWSSLLSNASFVEVTGLVITIQPKQRAESGVSMFESMWSSMTSSMQLAEECLKQGATDGKDNDQSQPLEGVELFAQTIDSILSRVKVKFLDTTIRVEHVPKDSTSGVAMEFKIKNIDYLDEAGCDPPTPPASSAVSADVLLQQGNRMYQVPAFSTKRFCLEGVSIYTDEYPSQARTFSRSVMSLSACSTPDSKKSDSNFCTAPVTPTSSSPTHEPKSATDSTSTSNLSLEPDPILVGKLSGRQEIRLKLKQTDGLPGPKVDLEVNLGSLTMFISPRQLHILIELMHGLATPDLEDTSNVPPRSRCVDKPMDTSDFNRVEQELQQQLNPDSLLQNKGLQFAQGWSSASLEDSDEEFLPMRPAMTDSTLSSATSMDASTTSSVGSAASSKATSPTHQRYRPAPASRKRKSREDPDPCAETSHFHVRLGSLAVVLLHEDVLTCCSSRGPAALARSSVQQMKAHADGFFAELGPFAVAGYGRKDFERAKERFLKACQLNHVRLLAAPVIVDGNERTTSGSSAVGLSLTAASLELLECLIDKKTPMQNASVEYVELLTFTKDAGPDDDEPRPSLPLGLQPDFKLQFKYVEKQARGGPARHDVQSQTEIAISLERCRSEVDVTIVDRISAVLNPQPLCRPSGKGFFAPPPAPGGDDPSRRCFIRASEGGTTVRVTSPSVSLDLRFPSPDLRPLHDMDRPPWWKRNVRRDVLTAELSEAEFRTSPGGPPHGPCLGCELRCREVRGLFREADADAAVPFLRATPDGDGFGPRPRIEVLVFPPAGPPDLDPFEEVREEPPTHRSGGADAFADASAGREPSPFGSKRVVHESDTPHGRTSDRDAEELVVPGDGAEMAEFVELASANSRVRVQVDLPRATLHLPSKHLYELLYNRIGTDLFLWESAAPRPPGDAFSSADGPGSDFVLSGFPSQTFGMCKSGIRYDSESDSEEGDGEYYSVYEHRRRCRGRARVCGGGGQTGAAVTLTVGRGAVGVLAPVRDSAGNVVPGRRGELRLQFEGGSLFSASGYGGDPGLSYVCVRAARAALHHGPAPGAATPLERSPGDPAPAHLEATVYASEAGAGGVRDAGADMLSVAVRVRAAEDGPGAGVKTFRVAVGLRGATLRHRVTPGPDSWFAQLLDAFDVLDHPVPGYDPPPVLTELHLHLWDCAVDYRPLRLPVRAVVAVGGFAVSSNVAAGSGSSTLRFIAEDVSLFLSAGRDPLRSRPVDLRRDYVCVADLGLFELSLRLCEGTSSGPRVDLRASNNVLHVRTCSDSARALADLLTYFASDGDLVPADEGAPNRGPVPTEPLLVDTGDEPADHDRHVATLSKSQTELVHDLMEEAMRETKGSQKTRTPKSAGGDRRGVEVFFFPDENRPLPTKPLAESRGPDGDEDEEEDWESEFCMVDKEAGSGIMTRDGPPEVRLLTGEPVRVADNHFSVPLGKTDLLKAPKHYPPAVLRYTLREMTVVWHMYGGSDFGPEPPRKNVTLAKGFPSSPERGPRFSHSPDDGGGVSYSKSRPTEVNFRARSPHGPRAALPDARLSWRERGGPGRQHHVLVELQLNKVRFRHEVYPEDTTEASRQVLLVGEVEVRDRLASSQINKFLYQYTSESRPRQSHANMVSVKAVHVRPDAGLRVQECCLRVSLLPLRLNIDQDALLFLVAFFGEASGLGGGPVAGSGPPGQGTPTHRAPVMSVGAGGAVGEPRPAPPALLMLLEEDPAPPAPPAPPPGAGGRAPSFPIFFRSVVFSPEVPVRLDYHGKRVDMTHGSLTGLLMGLGQLHSSELRLKRLSHRHGLLGFDKLVSFLVSEWLGDIKKNQLPSILGGVGPMHALVQLFNGIRDLFWLPIEQYQRDGRIVRGLQRGANSFTTSTAMAALELTNRLVQAIQAVAEMGYDMVSPGPSVRRRPRGGGRRRRYHQPADIREGVANACALVREGLGETAQTIARVASEEHEHKGYSGAVGGVLRQIPPTVVKPIILATEATSNVLGGMRSQLVPDARREAAEKWRTE